MPTINQCLEDPEADFRAKCPWELALVVVVVILIIFNS